MRERLLKAQARVVDTALLIRNTPDKELIMRIELIVSDDRVLPELTVNSEVIQVKIGTNHDFDDILDICAGVLNNEQLTLIYRLWTDDDFPRTFKRNGNDLTITARDN